MDDATRQLIIGILGSGGLGSLVTALVHWQRRTKKAAKLEKATLEPGWDDLNAYWAGEIKEFKAQRTREIADLQRQVKDLRGELQCVRKESRRQSVDDSGYIDDLRTHIWRGLPPPPPERRQAP